MSAQDWLNTEQFDPTKFTGYFKSEYGFTQGRRDLANSAGQTEAADAKYGGDPIAETRVAGYGATGKIQKFRPNPFALNKDN